MSSTGGRDKVLEEIERSLSRFAVPPGAGMVAAVSGGADSTALLCALSECRRADLRLTAVYVSHGIRSDEETSKEMKFLDELCGRLGVALRFEAIASGRVRTLASASHRSLEDVARTMRYELLEKAAVETGSSFIAVAHTLDDQLETVLMRILQGSSLRGVAGIPPRRGRVIRPLLACSREEVLAFLQSRGVEHCFDSTNEDERHLRNRVRKRVVPFIRSIFPSAAASAARLAQEARDLDALLDETTRLLVPWESSGEGYRVAARQFFAAPWELRVRSILNLYNERGLGERIPRGFFERLSRVSPKRSGGLLLEGHGGVVEQQEASVFWRPTVVVKTKTSYLMHVFGPNMYHITPALCLTVSTLPEGSAGGRGIVLPESLVRHPLVVRSRKPGDTIHMKEGAKSLKKLFNEWGVPELQRDMIPIVEDRGGIWAICGQVLGHQDRVRYVPGRSDGGDLGAGEIFLAFEMAGDQA